MPKVVKKQMHEKNSNELNKSKIVDEHFWFTATTIGINAFIMSHNFCSSQLIWAKIFSTLISLYAVFLIVHRSAADAGKIHYPANISKIQESEKRCFHKAKETWRHLCLFPKHLPFVICEFSGAFFYLIVVVISCIGVWFAC